MICRKTYTKLFLKITNQCVLKPNLDLYMKKWWYNKRDKEKGGLRLSDEGYQFLVNELELHGHHVPIVDQLSLSPIAILFLDNHMSCPYYLEPGYIVVFSEKEAFKLHLFSNDIRKLGVMKAMALRETYED